MSLCQAKRGFFTLYDCPKESHQKCPTCARSVCDEHFPSSLSECVECSAKQEVTSDNVVVRSYQLRHENLLKKTSSNIYYGSNLCHFYTKYDLRSFDIELSDIGNMVDSPDEIFFDS